MSLVMPFSTKDYQVITSLQEILEANQKVKQIVLLLIL
ncbi:hypothetical protein CU010_2020 [Enterococcus faecium]|nr:hypothetical protein [Enterococcus faecium]